MESYSGFGVNVAITMQTKSFASSFQEYFPHIIFMESSQDELDYDLIIIICSN